MSLNTITIIRSVVPENDLESFIKFFNSTKTLRNISEPSNEEIRFMNFLDELLVLFTKEGNLDLIKILIVKGACKINSAFRIAVLNGKINATKILICSHSFEIEMAVINAHKNGNIKEMEYLINKGLNFMKDGLLYASMGGHADLVYYFVNNGVTDKYTLNWAMYYAARINNKEIINYLIIKGANDWAKGLVASATGGHMDLVQFFHQRNLNITAFESAIWHANYFKHTQVYEFLSNQKYY